MEQNLILILILSIIVFNVTTASGFSNSAENEVRALNEKDKVKNWLLTKAWLIDNINLVKKELNELATDYNQHVEASNTLNHDQQQQLVQEVATLRADHAVLANQQKQIISLIKSYSKSNVGKPNQVEKSKNQVNNDYEEKHEEKHKEKYEEKHEERHEVLNKNHKKRHIIFSRHHIQQFQDQTRHNITELSEQLSSLHDITVRVFRDLLRIEKNMQEDKQNDSDD